MSVRIKLLNSLNYHEDIECYYVSVKLWFRYIAESITEHFGNVMSNQRRKSIRNFR